MSLDETPVSTITDSVTNSDNLSRRDKFALQAMIVLIPEYMEASDLALKCVEFADALIGELDK